MNRLLAQKIDLGVTLEIDEIVGEKQQPTPVKRGRWWWYVEEK